MCPGSLVMVHIYVIGAHFRNLRRLTIITIPPFKVQISKKPEQPYLSIRPASPPREALG